MTARTEAQLIKLGEGDSGSQPAGRVMSIKAIRVADSSDASSNALDPFHGHYDKDQLIPPYIDPGMLSSMLTNCDVMAQCISALADNIDGMGWHFDYVPPDDDPDSEPDENDKQEQKRLKLLFGYPNRQHTWIDLKQLLRQDKALTGGCYLEVARNIAGDIARLYHIPAKTMRMTRPGDESVLHVQRVREGDDWILIEEPTRFRKFCQLIGAKKVWFKEFGDPRSLNKETGAFLEAGQNWPIEKEATEIIHVTHQSPNTSYGEPPWLSEIYKIMGSYEANKVNYLFFENNSMPPFWVLVSGGTLGENAESSLKDYLQDHFKGADNFHKVMVLEAAPYATGPIGDEKSPPVKIEVKPMTQYLQKDAQFQTYISNNAKAVRESYKLPPALVGAAEEYSHAAIKMALIIAEQQVFKSERSKDDDRINRRILADMAISSWRMKSHGVPTTDDTQIIEAMSKVPEAVVYGHAVEFISELMGKEPPKLDPELANMTIGQIRSDRATLQLETALAQRRREEDQDGEDDEEDDDDPAKAGKQLLKGLRIARDALVQSSKKTT